MGIADGIFSKKAVKIVIPTHKGFACGYEFLCQLTKIAPNISLHFDVKSFLAFADNPWQKDGRDWF